MTAVDTRPGPEPERHIRDHQDPSASSPSRPRAVALLVTGNAISMTGNVIMTVAVPWLVLTSTGSAAIAGTAVFAGVVSATVGGLAAGRVVEAIGAVRASSVADLLSGLAVTPLPLLLSLDALQIWHVVLLTVIGTLGDAAGSAARQGLLPAAADAAGRRRQRANARFTSAEHLGYLLGAPAAGLLIAAFGVGPTLWVTVACFTLAALVVLRLTDLSADHEGATGRARAGLRETVTLIWGDPALRALVVFPTTAVLLVGPLAPLVLPVVARVVFDDPVVLGAMVAAYGAGGLLGAIGYGLLGPRLPRRVLYLGVFVVWPCAYAAILLVPSLPAALLMLLTLGVAAGALVPLQATIRQERSPAHLLTRVVGLSTASIPIAAPTAALATGFLIDGLGWHRASLLLSTAAVLVGVWVLTSPLTRHLDPASDSGPDL